MDYFSLGLISIGSLVMGFVVMWIGLYFIARTTEFTAAEFGGFMTAFFGGAVIAVFTTFQSEPETKVLFWWYPIGLIVIMLVYHWPPKPKTQKLVRLKFKDAE